MEGGQAFEQVSRQVPLQTRPSEHVPHVGLAASLLCDPPPPPRFEQEATATATRMAGARRNVLRRGCMW